MYINVARARCPEGEPGLPLLEPDAVHTSSLRRYLKDCETGPLMDENMLMSNCNLPLPGRRGL